MNLCQDCGLSATRSAGICSRCGGVCLRSEPWQPPLGQPQATTPLVQSRIPWLNGSWLKFEGSQPSGSFKDRVMRLLVDEAVESGARGAVVASSGNAAVAAASHCARKGIPLLVIVPSMVPEPIIAMVEHRGATILRAGEGPAAAHHLAKLVSEEFGLPNLASTFSASGCEWACRAIGHEIAAQADKLFDVDVLAASVSVGPVLLGAAHGIVEAGSGAPRMVAGQAAGCAPIARAFALGEAEVAPWEEPVRTKATSIADRLTGYAAEATFFLNEVRGSGGTVESAIDAELREIRDLLAFHDGLDVELSSCAAVAALRSFGATGPGAVCILTGSGVKETLSSATRLGELSDIAEFFALSTGDSKAAGKVEKWIHEYQ